jgi:hypothetical protein
MRPPLAVGPRDAPSLHREERCRVEVSTGTYSTHQTRFPWGSVLALRYRDSARSLWTLRPVTVVTAAIARSRILGASPTTPIIRVTRGEEGRRSYSLPPASAESPFGAPLRPTPFQRRGCELPVDLLGPCGAFTEPCRPLTFPLSPAGTPESESFPPDVLSFVSALILRPP